MQQGTGNNWIIINVKTSPVLFPNSSKVLQKNWIYKQIPTIKDSENVKNQIKILKKII